MAKEWWVDPSALQPPQTGGNSWKICEFPRADPKAILQGQTLHARLNIILRGGKQGKRVVGRPVCASTSASWG